MAKRAAAAKFPSRDSGVVAGCLETEIKTGNPTRGVSQKPGMPPRPRMASIWRMSFF